MKLTLIRAWLRDGINKEFCFHGSTETELGTLHMVALGPVAFTFTVVRRTVEVA